MAGTYTYIFTAGPISAEKGVTVTIEARIMNTYHTAITLTATGRVNGTALMFGNISKVVAAGAIESWYDRFIMPDRDVLVSVESWYLASDNQWYSDDKTTRAITLIPGQPVPSSAFRNLSCVVS